MPRNYKKELEWEQRKYRQILFKVGIDVAEKHREHLAKYNIKPVEWFRYAVSMGLVPPEIQNTVISVVEVDTDIRIGVNCVFCGKLNHGYKDGYFRCVDCDMGNYDPDEAEAETAVVEKPTKNRVRTASPSAELVQSWVAMYKSGMTYKAIAETTEGYDMSTIRKRIKKESTK